VILNHLFERDIQEVTLQYPNFKICNNGKRYLKGDLDISHDKKQLWGTYKIEIKASDNYPNAFPNVFEVGNSFPKNSDWHVYSDNSCCFDVPESELIICKDGLKVIDFIPKILIPYFANQKFRELNGYYLHGEYSHGLLGRIEFYRNLLNPKSNEQLIQMLFTVINGYNSNRQAFCPFCNIKLRKCHRNSFEQLSKIKYAVKTDFLLFLKYFQLNKNIDLSKVLDILINER